MSVNGRRLEFVGLIIPWNDLCVNCTGLIIRSQGDFARQQIYPVSPSTMDDSHQLPNIVQRHEYFRPNISLQNDTGDQMHDPGEIELWELMTRHLHFNPTVRPMSYVPPSQPQFNPNVRPMSYVQPRHLQYNVNARPVSHIQSSDLKCIPNVRPTSYIESC